MEEARMDIEVSEMAYLRYHGSESYGLPWMIRHDTANVQIYLYEIEALFMPCTLSAGMEIRLDGR